MQVYTKLIFPGSDKTGFISNAILRAGSGCFGLAIKDYCAIHAYASLLNALSA